MLMALPFRGHSRNGQPSPEKNIRQLHTLHLAAVDAPEMRSAQLWQLLDSKQTMVSRGSQEDVYEGLKLDALMQKAL